uniref:tumor necrosis factor alpha-induced protein 3-like n=1 Tax=Oncorhynchus gorbuscha TaxID=8017 RepID=UPI001EAEC7F9|nr:tumor necrosis factor alpha-induced protein 3-like [Oncorhynchus gorbuscha]XP_046210651.1 tumor necrosis factor alpha-induced protein 3-like [Oncorhynchus gorbuscha]
MSQGQNFLPKFLFVSNLLKAVKIRERVPNDVVKPAGSESLMHHLRGMHRYTLEMISMSQFPQAFQQVIQAAILDRAMQSSLEQEKKLNWCHEVKKMVPLRTNGDGNCLLHAASQYMLGVQDTDLVLRKALHSVLKENETGNFRARFQTELLQSQEFTQTGLRYSTMNWEEEWEKIIKMASPVSSRNGLQFDSLEDMHIFILSNILRRPIIIIADQVLRSMRSCSSFSPLNVGGIYLPLHWPPRECYKYPIVLGYDSQHFAPLITIKDSGPEIRAVPLINPGRAGFEELNVHFLMEKEQTQKERLLKDYLMLMEIPVIGLGYDTTRIINAARLDEGNLPEDMNLMEDYLQLVNHEYKRWQEDKDQLWAPHPHRPPPFSVSQLSLIEIRCATPRCTFYVSVDTQPHCHECFEKRQGQPNGRIESAPTKGGNQACEPGCSSRVRPSPSGYLAVLSSPLSVATSRSASCCYSETHAMKCKMPGCVFTRSKEHNGLCEHCFNSRQNAPGRCGMCHQEAFRIFNGLCPPCFQSTGTERGEEPQPPAAASSSGSLWTQPPPRESECSGRPCKRSGCQFFGTQQKRGFCTICYVDYQTNHLGTLPPPAPIQTHRASEAGFQNALRCQGLGCGAMGNAMLEGYCNKCFFKEQSSRFNQNATRAPGAHSPPLVMRTAKPEQDKPRKTQTQATCRWNGCSNFSPGCTDPCPECRATRGQRASRRERAGAPKETMKQSCKAQGCDHYANIEKQGFCNECDHFKQVYRG